MNHGLPRVFLTMTATAALLVAACGAAPGAEDAGADEAGAEPIAQSEQPYCISPVGFPDRTSHVQCDGNGFAHLDFAQVPDNEDNLLFSSCDPDFSFRSTGWPGAECSPSSIIGIEVKPVGLTLDPASCPLAEGSVTLYLQRISDGTWYRSGTTTDPGHWTGSRCEFGKINRLINKTIYSGYQINAWVRSSPTTYEWTLIDMDQYY